MSIQSIGTALTFQTPAAQVADTAAVVSGLAARQSGTLTTQATKGAGAANAVTTGTQAPTTPSQDTSGEESLSAAISSVKEYIKPFNNRIEFNIDDEVGRVVIKVVDKETEEVLLQIPSEEMLAIAKTLDNIKGLFVRQQA